MKTSDFEESYSRILECFNNPDDIFDFFGITQADIDKARQYSDIPGDWLLTLFIAEKVDPLWVLGWDKRVYASFTPHSFSLTDLDSWVEDLRKNLGSIPWEKTTSLEQEIYKAAIILDTLRCNNARAILLSAFQRLKPTTEAS